MKTRYVNVKDRNKHDEEKISKMVLYIRVYSTISIEFDSSLSTYCTADNLENKSTVRVSLNTVVLDSD